MAGYYGQYGGVPNTMQAGKEQQVEEVLRQFPGCRPINLDRSVLDLPVQLADGKQTFMRISLPPNFPVDRPTLSVLVPVQNPAVDSSGRLHVAGLDSWNHMVAGQAALVEVVREGRAALTHPAAAHGAVGSSASTGAVMYNPAGYSAAGNAGHVSGSNSAPMSLAQQRLMAGSSTSSSSGGAAGATSSSSAGAGAGAGGGNASSSNDSSLVTQKLSGMTNAELQTLLSDESAFQAAVKEIISNSSSYRTLAEISSKNRQLASDNLALGQQITEAKNQVAVVKSSEFASARAVFDQLWQRQEAVRQRLDTNLILAKLRQEADKLDTDSGNLVDDFYGGSTALAPFLDQYVSLRTKFHELDLLCQAAASGGWA